MKVKPVTQVIAFQAPDGQLYADYAEASRVAMAQKLDELLGDEGELYPHTNELVELLAENKEAVMPYIKALL